MELSFPNTHAKTGQAIFSTPQHWRANLQPIWTGTSLCGHCHFLQQLSPHTTNSKFPSLPHLWSHLTKVIFWWSVATCFRAAAQNSSRTYVVSMTCWILICNTCWAFTMCWHCPKNLITKTVRYYSYPYFIGKKLSHREVMQLSQRHITSKWHKQDLRPTIWFQSPLLNHYVILPLEGGQNSSLDGYI